MSRLVSTQLPEVEISETKAGILIQLKTKPQVLRRPVTKADLRQDRSMMYFQQLVMQEGKAALRAKSLNIFKSDVSVHIEIVCAKLPITKRLEKVLKAIFDGLNKHVIANDSLISNAQIWFKKGRNTKMNIEVEIEDQATQDGIFIKLDLPCVEKKDAVVYQIGAHIDYDPQTVAEMKMIERTFSTHSTTIRKQYQICHMLFYTNDLSKDVDNMFLAYINFIRQNGYLDYNSNIGIGMYKRYADIGDERTIISLVSK